MTDTARAVPGPGSSAAPHGPSGPHDVLPQRQWRARAADHARRVDTALAGHRDRARHRVSHPVEDFLFDYYHARASQLRRWSPGQDVVLLGDTADLAHLRLVPAAGTPGQMVDPEVLRPRVAGLRWIATLLDRTADRPAHLGCFGLHEWAMVHRAPAVRHGDLGLRLSADEIAATVERRGVACTHIDAYRFFTPTARPLNVRPLSRERQADDDQPGCLHVTMDLYKWATKMSPLTPAELVMDCFELAIDVRWVDMRASPYDLSSLPDPAHPIRTTAAIPIETASGRAEYITLQQAFAARAAPLRTRLRSVATAALDALDGQDPD